MIFSSLLALSLAIALPGHAQKRIRKPSPSTLPPVIFVDSSTHPIKVEDIPAEWHIPYLIKTGPQRYCVIARLGSDWAVWCGSDEGLLQRPLIGKPDFGYGMIFIAVPKAVIQLPYPAGKSSRPAKFNDKEVKLITRFKRNP